MFSGISTVAENLDMDGEHGYPGSKASFFELEAVDGYRDLWDLQCISRSNFAPFQTLGSDP